MAYTTIDKPTDYFNVKLWTGNGSASTGQTGVGFQPDWVWIKARTGTQGSQSHVLFDSVRGAGKYLFSDSNDEENTDTNRLTSFDSDGFTVGSNNSVNASSTTYVAWNWLAGGSASSNSDGSLASSVSANTTAGFSIVKYTGNATNSTVGHGLGVTPQVVIVKNLDSTGSGAEHWRVQHHKVSASKVLYLNLTNAEDTNGDFQSTYPGSSTFSISSADGCNKNGEENIAYCFAEKKGYSKFGKYSANNNSDGPFIFTGFRPAWLLLKVIAGNTGGWDMYDNKRATGNGIISMLQANSSGAQATSDAVDFLSNGFKIRNTSGNQNGSGDTIIYMAFAESPFVNSSGIPCNAR